MLLLLLTACSSYYRESSLVYDSLVLGDPSAALVHLESKPQRNRDTVLYNLNKALLLQIQSNYKDSNIAFELAKQEMQRLEATSIFENIESISVNEGRRSYAGQPYERLMLHVYMAINYLMLGNKHEARVEVMQADVKMNEWASATKSEGFTASAFVRYFSGMVFEVNREPDNALIAYRKAYQIYQSNNTLVPIYLKYDLLRLTHQFGLNDEHETYVKTFSLPESFKPSDSPIGKGEIIYLQSDGLVARLAEHTIEAFSFKHEEYIRVAVPYYPVSQSYLFGGEAVLFVDGKRYPAVQVENIDQLARDNLGKRMPAITARAVARTIVKHKIVREAKHESPLLGFIGNVATAVSERADTRSWLVLPARLKVARVTLKAGIHSVSIPGVVDKQKVEVKAGEKVFLLKSSEVAVLQTGGG